MCVCGEEQADIPMGHTLQRRDDGEDVQVVRVALPQAAVAPLAARQHRPVGLDDKSAVLSAHHLGAHRKDMRKENN